MTDPVRHQQLMELDIVGVCTEILYNARNELYMNMRFLDLALSSLMFEADPGVRGIRTDGFTVYYHPDDLCSLYRRGRVTVNRAYLHMILHCLFCHMDTRGTREQKEWNLACDIAVESMIDGLYQPCVYVSMSPFRRETYHRLRERLTVLNAEGVYQALREMNLNENQYKRLAAEFYVDSHEGWEEEEPPGAAMPRQQKWDDNREKMETDMETFSSEASDDSRSLLEQLQIENRERYDYKQFLRKFAVMKEELQLDEDSFDYIYYTYGLSMYGNMPLMEPQETKELSRIEDFVIVIDTSMSCSGELVKQFLEETYGVLSESESYFRKINIHIIQCDEKIQDDRVITSREEMDAYMKDFTVIGQGGTDFRPAFEYVNQLIRQQRFHRLKGLVYFTDGQGIYPVKCPVYDTAFVFMEDQYSDISVPPWAIKLIIRKEDYSLKEETES